MPGTGTAWGTWKSAVMCPKGSYIKGFRVRHDYFSGPWRYADDVGIDALDMKCTGSSSLIQVARPPLLFTLSG